VATPQTPLAEIGERVMITFNAVALAGCPQTAPTEASPR
jgi:hypothetical protein